ncbi:MAG: site-specific integrase [Leptospira sp.]|nr:site-specific integrase [Leptospira sp.]
MNIKSTQTNMDLIQKTRIDYREINNSILNRLEIQNILSQLKMNYYHQLIFKLAVSTGMTPQEIVDIRKSHINDDLRSLKVPFTDDSGGTLIREIGLTDELYWELYRHSNSIERNGYIFGGRWGQMCFRSLSYIVGKVKLLDGRNITLKMIRDSAAVTHYLNGISIRDLAWIMGNKNRIALKRRIKKVSSPEILRKDLFKANFPKSA